MNTPPNTIKSAANIMNSALNGMTYQDACQAIEVVRRKIMEGMYAYAVNETDDGNYGNAE